MEAEAQVRGAQAAAAEWADIYMPEGEGSEPEARLACVSVLPRRLRPRPAGAWGSLRHALALREGSLQSASWPSSEPACFRHGMRTWVSVLPRRRCAAMRFRRSASSSSGAVTPWSMRTAGRPAVRGRSAVSPSRSIVLARAVLGKRGALPADRSPARLTRNLTHNLSNTEQWTVRSSSIRACGMHGMRSDAACRRH